MEELLFLGNELISARSAWTNQWRLVAVAVAAGGIYLYVRKMKRKKQ